MMAASYPMWVLATKLGSHVRAEGTKERLHGEGLGTGCLIIHYCFSTCQGFTCSWCRRYNLRAHKPSEHNCCSTPREARALRAEPPGAVTDREHEQPGTGCAPSPQCCSHYWCLPLSCLCTLCGGDEGRTFAPHCVQCSGLQSEGCGYGLVFLHSTQMGVRGKEQPLSVPVRPITG